MWKKIPLRLRIYMILTALVSITMLGGSVMVWYTYRIQAILTQIIDMNIAGFQTAEALETALVNQKGFVSYYFQDGDPSWLRQLGEYRQIFKQRLSQARSLALTGREKKAVDLIQSKYFQYITAKDQVIEYYKRGKRQAGAGLHKEVRDHFFKILHLCEEYKNLHTEKITAARDESHAQLRNLRFISGTVMVMVLFLGMLLAYVLVNYILGPLRSLALEADPEGVSRKSPDEIDTIKRSVHDLIEDMDHTQFELVRSREHLVHAEKMALVGKLAAGMAHSIRNPLTSVKMRLFSLSRNCDESPEKEDFDVISEEIRHIDTIVQNFLEFSRPPKLKMQKINPSNVVDSAVELLYHRLQSYNVDIKLQRRQSLPEIRIDPEQLKEALINIVVNACEAMENGGSIVIREEMAFAEPLGRVVVIRLTDNGPGIPDSLREKVLQPFFSTKEEGTGLGLSIVARIVEEHGGWLDLTSKEGEGATFIITLPIKD